MKGPESSQSITDNILSNPYSGIQFAFDKRRRNLEKRKNRLLQYEADLKDGKKLSEQQIEARYCIGEVDTQLEFLKDISRVLQTLQKEYLRGVKQRDDGMKKELAEHERKRLEDFIYFQNIIERFGKAEVKDVFLSGTDNKASLFSEAKPEVSSKRRSNGAQDGFINGVEQVNGFGARGDERRQVRGAKSYGTQRNDFGSGGAKGGDFGKGLDAERGRTGGGSRRQERDNYDGPRNFRGVPRNSGRGFGSSGGRGGASNLTPRGSGFRNASNSNNNQMNGGFKGNGNGGGGLSGCGYNGPPQPPRRQLGFNFASDTF
ncbi:keratin [Loa loa]|uniref:Keratin n=1 Tax=Loa loa TaxID=7209 RepID=A0A1S0UGC3_LOALO|nr:keratin [Loa loa]EJD73884.1 keratin [Loa loa]